MNLQDELENLQERLSRLEAFDQEITSLPIIIKEMKEKKQQGEEDRQKFEAIGLSLPLLTERVTKTEESIAHMYQKFMGIEESVETTWTKLNTSARN